MRHAVREVEEERLALTRAYEVDRLGDVPLGKGVLVDGVFLDGFCVTVEVHGHVRLHPGADHVVAVGQAEELVEATLRGPVAARVSQVPLADTHGAVAEVL